MEDLKLSQKRIKLLGFVQMAHNLSETPLRKYTGDPYWTHPLSVAKIVSRYLHFPDELLMIEAALLHDVVEDTPYTLNHVRRVLSIIGYEKPDSDIIIDYVDGLTDCYTKEMFPNMPRKVRKQKEAERLWDQAEAVQFVKCADIIDNTSSIVRYDPKFAEYYLDECMNTLSGFRIKKSRIFGDAVETIQYVVSNKYNNTEKSIK